MLTVPSLLAGVALVAAVAAWVKARRLARRVERLVESYWELRYEHGQLRARVNRLDPESSRAAVPDVAHTGTPPPTGFIPLSSLRGRQ